MRIAVATSPAWLWSPWRLLRQMRHQRVEVVAFGTQVCHERPRIRHHHLLR